MKTIIVFLSVVFASPALAQSFDIAKQDGVVLLMRHSLAPGGGDPSGFVLGDCSTQRNLSDEGREDAKQTGIQLREAGIAINLVATSQWCRTTETAELLGLGTVVNWPSLNSFFGDRSTEPQQTAETLDMLKALESDARPILVTHQVNISALTGVFPQSGEIIATRLNGDRLEVIGRIPPP